MATTEPTQTTIQRYKGTRPGNYSYLPTIDVPILTPADVCATCEQPAAWDPKGGFIKMGGWTHADGTDSHRVQRRTSCRYCGCDDPALVVYRQHAWYDAVECARCGGVNGTAIGD